MAQSRWSNLVTGRKANLSETLVPPVKRADSPVVPACEPHVQPERAARTVRGRGRHKPGVMNKTEAAYSEYLELQKTLGLVSWYSFEAVKFKLADKTYYTPDFMVMMQDGAIELHEVKGFLYDDAAVKIKVAAAKFPFKFCMVRRKSKKDGGEWTFDEV